MVMIRRWLLPLTASLAIHAGAACLVDLYLATALLVPDLPFFPAAGQSVSVRVVSGNPRVSPHAPAKTGESNSITPPEPGDRSAAPAAPETLPPVADDAVAARVVYPAMSPTRVPPQAASKPNTARKASARHAQPLRRRPAERQAEPGRSANRAYEAEDNATRTGSAPDTVSLGAEGGPPGDAGSSSSHGPAPLPSNKPPEYPEEARRLGHAGVVTVRAVIDADGSVASARITRSSGYDALDRAALKAVQYWRFTPAVVNGVVSRCEVSLPVKFVLRD
jgi:protein TonB